MTIHLKVPVYNWHQDVVNEVLLPAFIFNAPIRKDIMARVTQWQLAKRREGNHKAKGISDISGTTKKPYKQKGTGRARQGSLRSPQFRGGAVIFGPVVRSHAFSLPKKVRNFGLRSSFSARFASEDVMIVNMSDNVPRKTKEMSCLFSKKTLILAEEALYPVLRRVVENIPHINLLPVQGVNVYDILRHQTLVISLPVIDCLEKRLAL